jgi:NAD(P)-dependent dehydrogenase (short-subunit alcohol dehydrogenase family)
MNRLQGKVALITGGTTGFGFAIAELFAREGANVVIAARRKEKGDQALRKIKELTGADAAFFPCDVTKEREVEDLVRKTIDAYRSIEILVNNAGVMPRAEFEKTTEEQWDLMMNTNLKGYFFCCKHAAPRMIKGGRGSIINMSSNVGLIGKGAVPIYSATKGGVTLLTRSLALRYGKYNIRVNCICPGTIVTDLNRDFVEKNVEKVVAAYPLNRLGTPLDVAYAAVYLASDESQWVTGAALPVDGGYTAGRED